MKCVNTKHFSIITLWYPKEHGFRTAGEHHSFKVYTKDKRRQIIGETQLELCLANRTGIWKQNLREDQTFTITEIVNCVLCTH